MSLGEWGSVAPRKISRLDFLGVFLDALSHKYSILHIQLWLRNVNKGEAHPTTGHEDRQERRSIVLLVL